MPMLRNTTPLSSLGIRQTSSLHLQTQAPYLLHGQEKPHFFRVQAITSELPSSMGKGGNPLTLEVRLLEPLTQLIPLSGKIP